MTFEGKAVGAVTADTLNAMIEDGWLKGKVIPNPSGAGLLAVYVARINESGQEALANDRFPMRLKQYVVGNAVPITLFLAALAVIVTALAWLYPRPPTNAQPAKRAIEDREAPLSESATPAPVKNTSPVSAPASPSETAVSTPAPRADAYNSHGY